MREMYRVAISVKPDAKKEELARAMGELEALGYAVESLSHGLVAYVIVPSADTRWENVLKKYATSVSWELRDIVQEFAPDDYEHAALFRPNHTGRDINVPRGKDKIAGVCHVAEYSDRDACGQCGAGVRQTSAVRLSGTELKKAGNLASIWIGSNVFWMMRQSLVEQLEAACGERLPRRSVETTGKPVEDEPWWQLTAEWAVPGDAVDVHRYDRATCTACGGEQLTGGRTPAFGGYITVRQGALRKLTLPPLMRAPFWGGELKRFPDGRIQSFPERSLWVRGDVGRALRGMKIRRLELSPIVEM